jgi:hypothetical protein
MTNLLTATAAIEFTLTAHLWKMRHADPDLPPDLETELGLLFEAFDGLPPVVGRSQRLLISSMRHRKERKLCFTGWACLQQVGLGLTLPDLSLAQGSSPKNGLFSRMAQLELPMQDYVQGLRWDDPRGTGSIYTIELMHRTVILPGLTPAAWLHSPVFRASMRKADVAVSDTWRIAPGRQEANEAWLRRLMAHLQPGHIHRQYH